MSKYPEQNDSKKRERRKKAIALSVGTCLLMGIAAFEIYRLSDEPVQKSNPVGLILPDPIDARYQRDLGEIENKLYDVKRLLFVKDAALENARLKTIREKLREKDVLVQNLENEKQSIEAKLEKEQAKLIELEKTIATLIDTVDLHKGSKEQGQEKLYRQIDQERYSHTQEVIKLNQEIAQAKETEEALRTELLARIENEKQLESAKNSTIQLLKAELAQHIDTLKVYETQIADLRNEKTRLTDEINQHHDLVRTHEDAGIEQAAHISGLNAKLTETELELAAVISKGQVQDQKINDLEDSIKHLITRTAGEQQEYDDYRKTQENKLSDAESSLAKLLDERERLISELKENYHNAEELNKVAEKGTDLEDQLQVERTLRTKLSKDHLALDEAYKAYKSNQDENERNLNHLEDALIAEKNKVQRLEDELKENLAKIDSLTASLNEEKTLTEELAKLKDTLSAKLNETSLSHAQRVNSEQELILAKQISDFNLATIYSDLKLEKSRLNDSTSELESLKRHIDNLTSEIARLTEDNQSLNNKIASQQQNAPNLSALRKEKEDIEALTEQLQNQLNDERSRIATLQIEQEERQALITRLNDEIEKEKSAAKDLENTRIALEDRLNAATEQHLSTTGRLNELEAREKDRAELVQKLTDDLEKQKILNSELQDQLERAPKAQDQDERLALIDQLKKQLDEERSLAANLKAEKEEFENELKAARADTDRLKGAQAEIESRAEWIEHLTKQLEIEKETNITLARLQETLEMEKGGEIERLTKELDSLRGDRSGHQAEIDRLTKQLDAAKERIDYYSDVEKMHDAKVDEVTRLTNELAEAKKQAEQVSSLQQELDAAKRALASNDTKETEAEVERLTNLLNEAKAENEKMGSLQKEIDDLKTSLAASSEKEAELNQLKEEHARLSSEIAKLKDDHSAVTFGNQARIDALTQELDAAKQAHASAVDSKQEIEADFEARKALIEELTLSLEKEKEINDRLKGDTSDLNQKLSDVSEESSRCIERAESRITSLHDQISQEYEKMTAIQTELQDKVRHISDLKSDLDEEKKRNLQLNDDLLKAEKAHAELDALKREKEEILQNLEKMKGEISHAENRLNQREQQLAEVENEKFHLNGKMETLTGEKNELQAEYESKIKAEQLNASLTIQDMDRRIQSLSDEREELKAKVNELQERHKALEIQASASPGLNKKIQDLEPELEQFRTELSNKEEKLQEAEFSLQSLKIENKKLSDRLNEILDAQSDDLLTAKEHEMKLQERILQLEGELKQLKKKP